jgi:ankyrin repeat protein
MPIRWLSTAELKESIADSQIDFRDALSNAIAKGDVEEVRKRLAHRPHRINDRRPATGSTPLGDATFFGNLELVKLLLDRDGNTPLIVAAFMCRTEVVKYMLANGASPNHKNRLGQTAIDVVSGDWNDNLARLYKSLGAATGMEVDLDMS